MKKTNRIIALLALILVAAGSLSAQVKFGVKAGVNVNKLHIQNPVKNFDTDNGCGFTGGVMTEIRVPLTGLCFDVSLMYTRMGGDVISGDRDQLSSDSKNFIEIPVNIKYKIGLPVVRKVFSPYIFTGPDFAFKLGGKDAVFATKTFQCAWNVGLGLEFFSHLQVSAGYGFGINNVFKSLTDYNTSSDIKTKNNYWTITAAYIF